MHVLEARLHKRGRIGQLGRALGARPGKRYQLARLNVRKRGADTHHVDRYEPRHGVGNALPRIVVRDMIERDTGVALEQFHCQVRGRSDQG